MHRIQELCSALRAHWAAADADQRWLFALYQLATWVTLNAVDDAAMMAFALS